MRSSSLLVAVSAVVAAVCLDRRPVAEPPPPPPSLVHRPNDRGERSSATNPAPNVIPRDYAGAVVTSGPVCAEIMYRRTLDRVFRSADLIVVGRPVREFVRRDHYTVYFPRDPGDPDPNRYPEDQWTEGPFLIETVLYRNDGVAYPRRGRRGVQAAARVPATPVYPGQQIRVSEPVGLTYRPDMGLLRDVTEGCTELKAGSRYVLFLVEREDGAYALYNYNWGRFDVDGTDPEDEPGGPFEYDGTKTGKQKLREELAARYGVPFKAPQRRAAQKGQSAPDPQGVSAAARRASRAAGGHQHQRVPVDHLVAGGVF